MKKLITGFLAAAAATALLLSGCAGGTPEPAPQTPAPQTGQPETAAQGEAPQDGNGNSMWQAELLFAETARSLAGTQAVVQYSGETQNIETSEAPKSGYVFLLMELRIEKRENGKSTFAWENACVEDADGNTYLRHENDTFLESYKLPRLKSVDLKIGTNQGFVCYEIPKDAAESDLWFVYDGEEGQIKLPVVL